MIADELIENLCAARDKANDPEVKNIWTQKLAEVARRKEYQNAENTYQPSR